MEDLVHISTGMRVGTLDAQKGVYGDIVKTGPSLIALLYSLRLQDRLCGFVLDSVRVPSC